MRGGEKEGGTQFASVLFASAFVNHIHHSKGDASFFPSLKMPNWVLHIVRSSHLGTSFSTVTHKKRLKKLTFT